MGVRNRLWCSGCSGGEHEFCHVIVGFNTNTAPISRLYDFLIGFHTCGRLSETYEVLAVIHVLHNRFNPGIKLIPKKENLALRDVCGIFDICACETEIQRSHCRTGLKHGDIACIPLHTVHHEMDNDVAFLYPHSFIR